MNKDIVELYTEADLARMRRSIRRGCAAHALLAALALTACLAMIARTGTGNAARMELAVILVSTVAGWIVLYGQLLVVLPRRRELRHAVMLRADERETVTGVIAVTDQQVPIRKSITALRVEVRGEGESRWVLVCQTRAGALAALDAATLYTVHGYVAAYEVPR